MDNKQLKPNMVKSYKAEIRQRYIAYAPQIRTFLLEEVQQKPILKADFYRRLGEYSSDLGTAIAAIELNASRGDGEWPAACRKARQDIFDGVEEVVMNERAYLRLIAAERATENSPAVETPKTT